MSDLRFYDELGDQLRAAVERERPSRLRAGWANWATRGPRTGRLLLAANSLVVVAVAVVLIAVLGHGGGRRAAPTVPVRPAPSRLTPSGATLIGELGVTSLAQLHQNFGVLRRPLTAADRGLHAFCGCGALLYNPRYIETLPSGYGIYVGVQDGTDPVAGRTGTLQVTVADPHLHVTSSAEYTAGDGYLVFPLSSGGADGVLASVAPDGVASVTWTFTCDNASRCPGSAPGTVTVPVHSNVAARQVPGAGSCRTCEFATSVVWRDSAGRTVASFDRNGSIDTPPYLVGARAGTRAILGGDGVGPAHVGESFGRAVTALAAVLGPAAFTQLPVSGCGIDHAAAWRSPQTAVPLVLWERAGRLAGYSYQGQGQNLIVTGGPGAVLTLPHGITLGSTLSAARRAYGSRFRANRGTRWRLKDGGTARGFYVPRARQSPSPPPSIMTITGAAVGCPPQTR